MNEAPLQEVCQIIMGQAPPGTSYNYLSHGLPLIGGAADLGCLTPHPKKYSSEPSKISEEGDIILCIRATIGNRNWSDRPYALGRGVAGLRVDSKRLYSGYLWHWLGMARDELLARSRGSTFKQITRGELGTVPIPLPPLEEQKRIATILDKADEIRRKRQRTIQLADEFLRSVFLDMFGDPLSNPKGWEVKKLAEHLSFLTSGSRGWARYYAHTGGMFLRIQNVGYNKLLLEDVTYVNPPRNAEARRTRVQAGDVLLSITADLGRTAVIPLGLGPTFVNQHLAVLRTQEIEPLYLSAFLSSQGGLVQFDRLNRDGVKAGLNFDDIRSLCIQLPPKTLQKKFCDVWCKHEQFVKFLGKSERKLQSLFKSLSQRAFLGEL